MANYSLITSVKLYNCAAPHDGTYVVGFASRGAADGYYGSCNDNYCSSKFDIGDAYYLRDRGYIKVDANADVLNNAGVNYCRWINSEVDNSRFFYGFVENIEYSAPKTALLTIRIDPWTTYFDRIGVNECLIEREHVSTSEDTIPTLAKIGAAEPLAIDPDIIFDKDYLAPSFNASSDADIASHFYGVINTGKPITYYDAVGWVQSQDAYVGGLPNASYWYAFDLTSTAMDGLREIIDCDTQGDLSVGSQDIIGVSMVPKQLLSVAADSHFPDWLHTVTDDVPSGIKFQHKDMSGSTMKNGYTPKNKKLMCYPYQTVVLRTYDGSQVELQPEKFTIGGASPIALDFYCNFALGNDSCMGIYPCHYDNNTSGTGWGAANFSAGITINSFPMIPLNIDAYKQYLAYSKEQRKSAMISMILNGLGTAASIYTGSIVPLMIANGAANRVNSSANSVAGALHDSGSFAALARMTNDAKNNLGASDSKIAGLKAGLAGSVVSGATQTVNQAMQLNLQKAAAQRKPNIMTSPASGQLLNKCDAGGAWLEYKSISYEQAALIDKYFDHYGYQVSRIGTPQWNSRSVVNYVKTVGCQVYGTIPTIYQNQLSAMFNNGLTVFHGAGNYGKFNN